GEGAAVLPRRPRPARPPERHGRDLHGRRRDLGAQARLRPRRLPVLGDHPDRPRRVPPRLRGRAGDDHDRAPGHGLDPVPMIRLGSTPAAESALALPPAPVDHTVLARAGEGPWPRYRIVGLVHLGGGELLAAFDGRETGQDVPDPTCLLQRRSLDGGRTWGPLETLRDADREARVSYCDPSLIHDPGSGRLFAFHTRAQQRGVWDAVAGTDDADRDVMGSAVGVSEDGGRSWA